MKRSRTLEIDSHSDAPSLCRHASCKGRAAYSNRANRMRHERSHLHRCDPNECLLCYARYLEREETRSTTRERADRLESEREVALILGSMSE